jgi:drug/metabolite transporter (DMT)-like permease
MWDKSSMIGEMFALMAAFFWLLYLNVRRRKEPMRTPTKFLWLAGFYTFLLVAPAIHHHRITLMFLSEPDLGLVFASITTVLWITYFYQLWRAKRAR